MYRYKQSLKTQKGPKNCFNLLLATSTVTTMDGRAFGNKIWLSLPAILAIARKSTGESRGRRRLSLFEHLRAS